MSRSPLAGGVTLLKGGNILVRDDWRKQEIKPKIIDFLRWLAIDIYRAIKYGKQFNEYGLTMYVGRQGSGKTIGMVRYLEDIRIKYPKAIIITNFGYINEHYQMNDWHDLLEYRNGTDGVIFAIDEIQNEFSSTAWQNFPEFILSEITQQRKQRIKIIASSQVFTRVVKALREQCYEVVECKTIFGRWTFLKCFDADEYNTTIERPEKRMKLFRKWRKSFVQNDSFRELYNSYDKIEKLKNIQVPSQKERKLKLLLEE